MNKLEAQLLDLGQALEIPPTPELMSAVRGRLAPRRGWRHRLLPLRPRRPLAVAITLAALAAGTAAAVPPIRHAVEQVFGLNGAVVKRVPHLPASPKGSGRTLNLGRRVAVADARHAASFQALLPPRGVDAAYVSKEPPGGRITLVVGRSLLMEFRGQSEPFIQKLIGPGTRFRRIRVNGGPGVFLDRAPHEVFFINVRHTGETDVVRLEGSVLLWQQGPLILRIERAGSLARALALARSLS
jgi:hypothetical protein